MARTWDYRRGQWKDEAPRVSSPKSKPAVQAKVADFKDIERFEEDDSFGGVRTSQQFGGSTATKTQPTVETAEPERPGFMTDNKQDTFSEDGYRITSEGDVVDTRGGGGGTTVVDESKFVEEAKKGPEGLSFEEKRARDEQAALDREQERVRGMVGTMFGSEAGMGYGRGIVQGELRKQIEQFGQLEGDLRSGYTYWNNDASGGIPLSAREAYTFLGQAQGREANRITETEVTPAMYDALRLATDTLTPTEQAVLDAYTRGQPVYKLDGEILAANDPRVFEYSQIQDFRNRSMELIDDYRINKQALLQKKIEQDYKAELDKAEQESKERIARLEREQREAVAKADREAAEEVARIRAKGDLDVAKSIEQETARGKQARLTLADQAIEDIRVMEAAAGEERTTLAKAGEQERKTLGKAGIEERATQKERLDAEKAMATEELEMQKHIAVNEMNTRMAIVLRETTAQSNLLYTQNTLETERINAQNEWQSLENDKLHFLENKRIDEAIASNQAQEELAREQQQIERESQKLNLIMSISQNPALLFFMNESGMLTTPGETIMGEDVNDMISELTASIDPANLPNIQTYNALGEQEQARVRFRQAATRGVSPEGLENFLTGSSPFTRGRQSTIKVGRA